jgi:hypothetical protein
VVGELAGSVKVVTLGGLCAATGFAVATEIQSGSVALLGCALVGASACIPSTRSATFR